MAPSSIFPGMCSFRGLFCSTPPPPPTYDYQNGTPTDQYGGGYSSETSSSDEGGGYAGYPNEAPPHSNERTGHPEEIEPCVDWSWTVKEMKYECWRRGLRNFARLNKGGLIRLLNGGKLDV